MTELHAKGIVHRDLAYRNVMLSKWLQAKVGDFGLAVGIFLIFFYLALTC